MEGLTRSVELHGQLNSYAEQVEGLEELISYAEQRGAARGLTARYWRKQAEKYKTALATARMNLERAQAEVDAFEAHNSEEARAERFRRGELGF